MKLAATESRNEIAKLIMRADSGRQSGSTGGDTKASQKAIERVRRVTKLIGRGSFMEEWSLYGRNARQRFKGSAHNDDGTAKNARSLSSLV